MTAAERLLRYVQFDTQSNEFSDTCPSTDKQKVLALSLVEEMKAMGISDAYMDAEGYVYGTVPGDPTKPVIGLIAHMDTAPDASGANIQARIVPYEGGDIVLNEDEHIVMKETDFPNRFFHKQALGILWIVCYHDQGRDIYIIIDGFHRYRVMLDYPDIYQREEGKLPVSVVDKPLDCRMASTIRHNRARGSHNVDLMSNIIQELHELGRSDAWISKHLGMDRDEILRLKQLTGLTALFRDVKFSRAFIL